MPSLKRQSQEKQQIAVTITNNNQKKSNTNRELPNEGNKAMMIIATYPDSPLKFDVIWSQLECFTGEFDRIIISAPNEFKENVTEFLQEVNRSMPSMSSRLEAQFHVNDRYDTGLWCDALVEGNVLKPRSARKNKQGKIKYDGRHSQYDRFLLINDSMLAVRETNEFLEALQERNASLVSLSYWGEKEHPRGNLTNKYVGKYWLESPLRAFSLEGIQLFADEVCLSRYFSWRKDCPHLRYADIVLEFGVTPVTNRKLIKRCIVEKTEIDVVDHYSLDKVHGLYPGETEKGTTWSNSFKAWLKLREMSFPVLKVNDGPLIRRVRTYRPKDIQICTALKKKISVDRSDKNAPSLPSLKWYNKNKKRVINQTSTQDEIQ